MTNNSTINLLITYGAAVALACVYFGWLKQQAVAQFRASLFELRRELFLLMAEGKIEGSSPAYAYLRNTLNGLLRSAESITFTQIIFTYAWAQTTKVNISNPFPDHVALVKNKAVQAALISIRQRTTEEIGVHLLRVSKFSPLYLVVIYVKLRETAKQGTKRFQKYINIAEIQGEQFGEHCVAM